MATRHEQLHCSVSSTPVPDPYSLLRGPPVQHRHEVLGQLHRGIAIGSLLHARNAWGAESRSIGACWPLTLGAGAGHGISDLSDGAAGVGRAKHAAYSCQSLSLFPVLSLALCRSTWQLDAGRRT